MVWVVQWFEDIFTKNDWVIYLINYEGFCRKYPATPGLLKSYNTLDKIGVFVTDSPCANITLFQNIPKITWA